MNERPARHAKLVAYPVLKKAELGASLKADANRSQHTTVLHRASSASDDKAFHRSPIFLLNSKII
jgi:hypothetical protein